jgi:hypothetical protein
LKQHILRLPSFAWKPYRDEGDVVSECADVLNYWLEAEAEKKFGPLRCVAIRIRKKLGDLSADGLKAKYFAVFTNVWDWEPKRLLEWHREKAGTIEAIHDVLKNELATGALPAGASEPMRRGYGWRFSRTMLLWRREADGAAGGVSFRASQAPAVSDLQHGGQDRSSCAPRDLSHCRYRMARLDATHAG